MFMFKQNKEEVNQEKYFKHLSLQQNINFEVH